VRFRQGVIEAYLSSCHLAKALQNSAFSSYAYKICGREFLAALVLVSRRESQTGPWTGGPDAVRKLCRAAEQELDHEKKLGLYEAAVEIDAIQPKPWLVHRRADGLRLAESIAKSFHSKRQYGRGIIDAKVALVQRIGQSAQEVAEKMWDQRRRLAETAAAKQEQDDRHVLGEIYRSLFKMGEREAEHAVKLAITQEIADGTRYAFDGLTKVFAGWWGEWFRFRAKQNETSAEQNRLGPEELIGQGELCAWLAPLFCSTVLDSNDADKPLDNLDRWLDEYLCWRDPQRPESRPWISLEIALAQGFMLAANRRPAAAERYERHRSVLVNKAESALRHSRFWFAQLTLIQALTLLTLPSDRHAGLRDRGHGSDPQAMVDYWLSIAGSSLAVQEHQGGHQIHPFVRKMGELAVHALNTRQPEHFCWVDESGTIKQVGSLPMRGSRPLEHRLWLLPSFGWSSLHPDARQLLGDVQVMLNLANRGNRRFDREVRLAKLESSQLPPCMTRDRSVMRVTATAGSAEVSVPGSNCHDDCQVRLCPYPPFGGELSHRDELTEGFCRHLSRVGRPEKYERALGRKAIRRFWESMVVRVRPKIQEQGKPSTARLRE
jgi:hypothetical protein